MHVQRKISSPRGVSRLVPLTGSVNFRDLGGYRTRDGRRVRHGQVFRSDHLAGLHAGDKAIFARLGIRLVCDLRTKAEQQNAPDQLPDDEGARYLHLPIANNPLDPMIALARVKKGDTSWLTREFLLASYLATIEQFAPVWGEMFGRLADPAQRPLVFHCTGGKDRTGVGAALLLLALGVPEQTVLYDYSLTNVYNAERILEIYARVASYGVEPAAMTPYLTASRRLMVYLLGHIRNTYGSAGRYLTARAGLDQGTLASLRHDLLVG